jgi:hypothetical protein
LSIKYSFRNFLKSADDDDDDDDNDDDDDDDDDGVTKTLYDYKLNALLQLVGQSRFFLQEERKY